MLSVKGSFRKVALISQSINNILKWSKLIQVIFKIKKYIKEIQNSGLKH